MNYPLWLAITSLLLPGCLGSRVLGRVLALPHEPKPVEHKLEHPERPDARLSVLWIGHATVLIQIDDKFILTDPVFTRAVGVFSPRLVEPGLDSTHVPWLSVVAVSHLHFDHLSYDSLEMLADRVQLLVLPPESRANMPRYDFEMRELEPWQTYAQDGLRVTAVPARHVGGRWWLDKAWNKRSYTAYVFEYHGISVYFGGDTRFDATNFRVTHQRFTTLDLAVLPICPAQPQSVMQYAHMNPEQALDALAILEARRMVPIHFDTFINSDDLPGDCSLRLLSEMAKRNLDEDRVAILKIGEQRVLMSR